MQSICSRKLRVSLSTVNVESDIREKLLPKILSIRLSILLFLNRRGCGKISPACIEASAVPPKKSPLVRLDNISEDLQPIGDYRSGINYVNFIDGFIYICNKNDNNWYCQYCNKSFDTKKGCLFHENVYCKKNKRKTKKNNNITDCGSDDNYNFSDDEF